MAGVQNDEALFSAPLYEEGAYAARIRMFGRSLPVMVLSYLGALKTWLYAPIFALFPPSVCSLRVPVLLLGAATVWLFWLLLARSLGMRAAAAGAVLLASDTSFLLTTVYDWGPVALQHLLLVAGLLLFARFHQTGSRRALGWACFLWGLALWDKALFLWLLSGAALGALAAFPQAVRRALTKRNAALAALAFLLGAWPVLYYNLRHRGETLRSNAVLSAEHFSIKAVVARRVIDGSALMGYVVGENWFENPREPRGALERASVRLSEMAGEPRSNLMEYALLAALLLLPVVWRTPARRAAVFALVFLAVAWLQMALTHRAGGGAHHVVLLWPIPHLLASAVFAAASPKLGRAGVPALACLLALLAASNLLTTNQNYSQLVRNGAMGSWTDAIQHLSEELGRTPAKTVYAMDWGLIDNLRMLHRGRLPLGNGLEVAANETPGERERLLLAKMAQDPEALFVSFLEPWEMFPGAHGRVRKLSAEAGLEESEARTVTDSNGRAVILIYRLRPARTP